ncbi:MAG: penicillin-binding protein 1C [Pseudomonadota bacterium]
MAKTIKILAGLLILPVEAFVGLYFAFFMGSVAFELAEEDADRFLDPSRVASLVVRDRNGTVLRDTPSSETETRAKWVKLEDISWNMVSAVLAAEDHRFFDHGGVDPLAMGRAMLANINAGKFVEGGSTITQQVVKVATGGSMDRTVRRKLMETAGAMFIERKFGKERILEAYLNWVVFGNLTRGVGAAGRLYFNKPPKHLTISEAAALAALLRAPTAMNPYTHPEKLEKRRRWILERMLDLGMIASKDYTYSKKHPPEYVPPSHPFLAPHLVEEVLEKAGQQKFAAGEIVATIDGKLQDEVEHLADKMIEKVRHLDISNAAVIVIDNESGEVLAYVGSSAYFDEEREGMNDGVMALRSPGSTLKPFIYAAAFERDSYPSLVTEDVETAFSTPIGMYRPRNYDGLYHGPVRLRVALGSSYNIPAVKLVSELGTGHVLDVLRNAGLESLDKAPDHYGVAIAVGDGEVSLFELASAYAALARGGFWKEPAFIKSVFDAEGNEVRLVSRPGRRVFSPQASYLVSDILSDPAARTPGFGRAEVFNFPFPAAVKTGTSSDYRDNWTVGYSSEVTVGVWVGNFSGKPMGNVSGITGAGPLFYQVMKAAMKGREGRGFEAPAGIVTSRVCPLSGREAGEHCRAAYEEKFIEGRAPEGACSWHVAGKGGTVHELFPEALIPWAMAAGRYDPTAYELAAQDGAAAGQGSAALTISSPREGSAFIINPDVPGQYQRLKVHVAGANPDDNVKLYVDGRLFETSARPFVFTWTLAPGEHTLEADTKHARSPPITISVH